MNHMYAPVGAHPRADLPLVQQVNPFIEGEYITDRRNQLETRTGTAGLGFTFLDGGSLGLDLTNRLERLEEPFRLGDALVSTGSYGFTEGSVRYGVRRGGSLQRFSLSGGDGVTFRIIAMTGERDSSVATNTPGQSGDPASSHYSDLLEPWLRGECFPLAFSRSAVDSVAESRHVLAPFHPRDRAHEMSRTPFER